MITLNATAIFELSRNSARLLIREGRGGRVINIASLMTAAAQHGIVVNAIAPEYVDADLNKILVQDPGIR